MAAAPESPEGEAVSAPNKSFLLSIFLVSLLTVCLLFGGLYIVHKRQVTSIESNTKIETDFWNHAERLLDKPHLKSLLADVGSISEPRETSFLTASESKPPGVKIRIGIFGDSIAWGEDVGGGHSVSAHLQRILAKRIPETGIEVLNFANKWHGLHQSFRIYEQLADRYEIDAAIFVHKYERERDLSMNHSYDSQPYYIHGRYVLDSSEKGYRWISPVQSQEFKERFYEYNSFIPSWPQWRYDRRAPGFFRTLERITDRTFINPVQKLFTKTEFEWQDLATNILNHHSRKKRPIIYLIDNYEGYQFFEVLRETGRLKIEESVSVLFAPRIRNSFFWYWGHHTGAGNFSLAEFLANYIYDPNSDGYKQHLLAKDRKQNFMESFESGEPPRAFSLEHLENSVQLLTIRKNGKDVAIPVYFNSGFVDFYQYPEKTKAFFLLSSASLPILDSLMLAWKSDLSSVPNKLETEDGSSIIPIRYVPGTTNGMVVNLPNGFENFKLWCSNSGKFENILHIPNELGVGERIKPGVYGFKNGRHGFMPLFELGPRDCDREEKNLHFKFAISLLNQQHWVYFRPLDDWHNLSEEKNLFLSFQTKDKKELFSNPINGFSIEKRPFESVDQKGSGWVWRRLKSKLHSTRSLADD